MDEFCPFPAQPEYKRSINVVELFCGGSGVGSLRARRRLTRGDNLDLVTGFHLTSSSHQQAVAKYINTYKRLVVVMQPPAHRFRTLEPSKPAHAPRHMEQDQGHWRAIGAVCSSRV